MNPIRLLAAAHDLMTAAIESGDWKIDGACDPDSTLRSIEGMLRDAGWVQNSIDGHWQYGHEWER